MLARISLIRYMSLFIALVVFVFPAGAKDSVKNSANIKTNDPVEADKSFTGVKISKFELENGLKVIVIPDNRAPVVTHMVWYKVGSAEDPVGKSGIAHFLEHLMFKGTRNVPAGEFSAKVAEIGGQENAFTSSDYTAYYQKVSPAALKMVMRYEADRMENLVLREDQVNPERDVVLEERRSRIDNSPGAILGETLEATLYLHHPYGIPVIGYEHEIKTLNLNDAISFYDRYYTPNNAILVVAGDIDEQTVHKYAMETYAKVKRRAEPGPRIRLRDPQPTAARTVTYRDKRVTTPSLSRMYLVPSYNNAEPGEAEALDLLSLILSGTSKSRLDRALKIDKTLATSVGARYSGGSMDDTRLSVSASPRGNTTIEQLEREIDQLLQKVIEEGVTQAELDHARDAMIKSEIYARDSQTTMARIIGSVYATGGDLDDVTQWTGRLKKVTTSDVNRVAAKYLKKSRSVTGYLLPETQPES